MNEEPRRRPPDAASHTRVIASGAEALRRARALAPALRERARQTDLDRRVPDANIAAILEQGLFHLASPKAFGGSQLGLNDLIETSAEIAAGCGSTGWVYGVLAGHKWLLSLFPVEAQREVFGDPAALVASVVRLGGDRPSRVAGGYLIRDAVGKYCSGIDHAKWILLGVGVENGDDPPEARYLLAPKSDVEIIDDWHTVGMRGTGSRSLRVKEAFVPEYRSVAIADLARGASPGAAHHNAPLYRAPFPQVLPLTLAGVPVGIARAALNVFVENQKVKMSGWPEQQIGEQSASFVRISWAGGDVAAAAALLRVDCLEMDACADGAATSPFDRARYIRDIAWAGQQCRRAVNNLYEAAGGSATYDTFELQRIWRDVNAATAHNSFVRDRAGGMFGRAALGLPPGKFDKIGH